MTQIPEPKNSGSSGTQASSENLAIAIPEKPFPGQPIEQTVIGLAANKSRNLGGEVAANLIAGSFSQISHELSEARAELRSVRLELDQARLNLQDEKISNAVLKGKLKSAEDEKTIRNVCLVAGTAIVSFGIDQMRSKEFVMGTLLILIGIALSLVGWFSVGGEKSK